MGVYRAWGLRPTFRVLPTTLRVFDPILRAVNPTLQVFGSAFRVFEPTLGVLDSKLRTFDAGSRKFAIFPDSRPVKTAEKMLQ